MVGAQQRNQNQQEDCGGSSPHQAPPVLCKVFLASSWYLYKLGNTMRAYNLTMQGSPCGSRLKFSIIGHGYHKSWREMQHKMPQSLERGVSLALESRGEIYRRMAQYEEAIVDFNKGAGLG